MTITNADVLTNELLIDLVRQKGYYWDGKKAQYISKWNGQAVKHSTVLAHIEKYNLDYVGQNIDRLTQNFIDGKMDMPTWEKRMALELKHAHVINLQIGKGGQNNVTFSDYGKIGARLKFQYKRLTLFAQQIATGAPRKMSIGQIKYRATLYANSVRSSYFTGLTQAKIEAGFTKERRITTSEKPCDVCSSLEAQGFQPIGSLPDPGTQCLGLTNCHCHKDYE